MTSAIKVGIIAGTGLDNPDILENRAEKFVKTPFGEPSDALILGTIRGIDCVLLPRHGRKHHVMPSRINYRANLFALKEEGCTHVIVTTACGSLREDMMPGDMAVIDQIIDRTHGRDVTFYDGSTNEYKGVCHIPMNEPFCEQTRKVLIETVSDLGYRLHDHGTMITINGPRFSSKAESKMFIQFGADLVNMSSVPEVALANELGLCYASLALITDYDSWRDDGEAVSVELALKTFKENAEKAKQILIHVIPKIAEHDWTETIKKHQDVARKSVMLF